MRPVALSTASFAKIFVIVSLALITFFIPHLCLTADLLILTSPEAEARHQTLAISLDAQLMDYDSSSNIKVISTPVIFDETLLPEAQRIQDESGEMALFWMNQTHFFLYVHVNEDSHLFTRPLPRNSENWEVQSDAIAASVQSVLSPWLSGTEDTDTIDDAPETTPAAASVSKLSEDAVLQDGNKARAATSSPAMMTSTFVRPGIGAAFTTNLMSEENLFNFGAAATLNLKLKRSVLLSVEPGISVKNSGVYRMIRIPLRIRSEFFWEMPSFWIGIGVSLVMDVVRSSSTEEENSNTEANLYMGAGGSLSFTYKFSPIFSIVIRGGFDIYQASDRYFPDKNHNSPQDLVFYYGPVQGRAMAGIIFWLR